MFKEILEATPEGILFIDEQRIIWLMNRAAREVFHCQRQADPWPDFGKLVNLLGFDPLAVGLKTPLNPRRPRVRRGEETLAATLQSRVSVHHCWQREVTIFGVPFIVRGTPFASERHDAGGVVLCFKDIRKLRQWEQIISDSLSFACHELRTPLTAIRSALNLLSSRRLGQMSEEQQGLVRLAWRNMERLDGVVTRLLDLSRLESCGVGLKLSEVNPLVPVEKALAALESMARNKKLRLQSELKREYPLIFADGSRLEQVVYNLVHNAIKFTPEGGIIYLSLELLAAGGLSAVPAAELAEEAPAYSGGDYLLLTVADTGVGIPPGYEKTVFAKFTQVPTSTPDSRQGGSGLGLSLVKTVVEAHGGKVWVESELEKGSKFRVLLPVLSPKARLLRLLSAALQRLPAEGSPLSLVVLKVSPAAVGRQAEGRRRKETPDYLAPVVLAAKRAVRLRNDRVEVLDPSLGLIAVLAEVERRKLPALLERLAGALHELGRQRECFADLRLSWGTASYPGDGCTAEELAAAAVEAVSRAEADEFRLLEQ